MRLHKTWVDEYDDAPYEVQFEPVSEVLTERVGDRLVVAYLAHDEDCENPMTSYDGEGALYTKPSRCGGGSITDTSRWGDYLGLNEYGDRDLELDVVAELCRDKLRKAIQEDFAADFTRIMLEAESNPDETLDQIFNEWYGLYTQWGWNDDDQEFFANLPDLQSTVEQAWDEAYEAGEIGDYLAVPVSYCSSNHGPGTASADTTDLFSADAVWVPDKEAIANMNFEGCVTYADKLKVAAKYAESVLEEYIKWCNGECYGCVVETHKLVDDEWKQESDDACWGYIGYEYAEEALSSEFFKPTINAAHQANADDIESVRCQFGKQLEMEL